MEPAPPDRSRADEPRPAVAEVGPDPDGRGGMAAVTRGILSSRLRDDYALVPIVTYRVGAPAKSAGVFLSGLIALTRWMARHRGGVVHVHSAVRGSLFRKALVVLAARALRHPVILHVHAGAGDIDDFIAARSEAERRIFAFVFRRATRVVTVSCAGASRLAAAFGRADIEIMPNAVPHVDPVGPAPGTSPLELLYLGGFDDPAKGGAVLVRALPLLLADEPSSPPLRVTLAGPGSPPPGLAAHGDRVRWLGWLDEEAKRRAFSSADVVLLPSISEGLPVVLLEAMAHGRAIVAARVGGIPDVVDDGRDALLVPASDERALADAARRLAGDPQLRASLGASAQTAVAAFDEEVVVDRLDALLRGVLDR